MKAVGRGHRLVVTICAMLFCSCAWSRQESFDASGEREITVRVHMEKWPGEPLPGILLSLQTAAGDYQAMGDAQGRVTLRGKVASGDSGATVTYGSTKDGVFTALEEQEQRERQRAILHGAEFYWPYLTPYLNPRRLSYVVPLEPGKSEYDVRLIGTKAIKISGRLLTEDRGLPMRVLQLCARLGGRGSCNTPDGKFTLNVAPQGLANELFLTREPYVYSIAISAELASEDIDLNPMYQPATYAGKSLERITLPKKDFQAIEYQALRELTVDGVDPSGITLISPDAQTIVTILDEGYFPSAAARAHHYAGNSGGWPNVPFGTYYIVPGRFEATSLQLGVLDALRAGHDLSESGLSMIEIQDDGQALTINYDAVESTRVILRIFEWIKRQEAESAAPGGAGSPRDAR